MVVENDHQALPSQLANHSIQDIHRVLTLKLRVGSYRRLAHDGVRFVQFVRPKKANYVKPHAADLVHNLFQRRQGKTGRRKILFLGAVPIDTREFNPMALVIDDPATMDLERQGGQRGNRAAAAGRRARLRSNFLRAHKRQNHGEEAYEAEMMHGALLASAD